MRKVALHMAYGAEIIGKVQCVCPAEDFVKRTPATIVRAVSPILVSSSRHVVFVKFPLASRIGHSATAIDFVTLIPCACVRPLIPNVIETQLCQSVCHPILVLLHISYLFGCIWVAERGIYKVIIHGYELRLRAVVIP